MASFSETKNMFGIDILKETGYVARMFYDNWECPLVITSQEEVDVLNEQSLEMIKLGLKTGESLKNQIKLYIEQMDNMSNRLSKAEGNRVLDEDELIFWWLNVFALIRMKALENDDANGLLVIKTK